MKDLNETLEHSILRLKQERDELHLKLHLGKEDLSDEWEKLESKLGKLESKAKELGNATAEASKDVGAAAKLLAEEIANGFNKIRKHL